jgi:hypothetical protein
MMSPPNRDSGLRRVLQDGQTGKFVDEALLTAPPALTNQLTDNPPGFPEMLMGPNWITLSAS